LFASFWAKYEKCTRTLLTVSPTFERAPGANPSAGVHQDSAAARIESVGEEASDCHGTDATPDSGRLHRLTDRNVADGSSSSLSSFEKLVARSCERIAGRLSPPRPVGL